MSLAQSPKPSGIVRISEAPANHIRLESVHTDTGWAQSLVQSREYNLLKIVRGEKSQSKCVVINCSTCCICLTHDPWHLEAALSSGIPLTRNGKQKKKKYYSTKMERGSKSEKEKDKNPRRTRNSRKWGLCSITHVQSKLCKSWKCYITLFYTLI